MRTIVSALGFCLGLASYGAAAPAPQPQVASTTNIDGSPTSTFSVPSASSSVSSTNACGQLANNVIGKSGNSNLYKPSAVQACLSSVPFDSTEAVNYIDYIANFTQFQSTLGYLKSPPAGYPYPAVDIVARLQDIRAKAASSSYSGEYAFERDIYSLISSARDGHFKATPGLVAAFALRRIPLVSISSDGTDLPKVFFKSDIVNSTGGFTPSEVTRINGEDSSAVVGGLSVNYQDPDASFNSGFYNPANFRVFNNGEWATSLSLTWNDTTTYTFANGSSVTLDNGAIASFNITGIMSGSDLYRRLVLPVQAGQSKAVYNEADLEINWEHLLERRSLRKRASPTQSLSIKGPVPTVSTLVPTGTNTAAPSASATALPAQLGLPSPIIISPDLSVSGYFLEEQPDTAYLYVAQFTDTSPGTPTAFQQTVTKFLAICRQQNKRKLVIDMRGNPGGAAFTAYDLFKQILPKNNLITKLRMRNHIAQDSIGTIISQLSPITEKDLDTLPDQPSTAQKLLLAADVSSFNAGNNLQNPDGKPYKSWKDFNGPVNANGDKFSNFYSVELSNEALLEFVASGVVPAGYGSNKNLATTLFDAANITIITDSQCSSSCGLFTNLMVTQGNVSTITFGGRPNKSKIYLIGGTQGGQVLKATQISNYALAAGALVDAGTVNVRLSDAQKRSIENLLFDNDVQPLQIAGGGMQVNFLDNVRPDSEVPLQFRQIASGCRAFYIADDVVSMRKTWVRLSAGNFTCVDGGAKPGTAGNGGGQRGKTSGAAAVARSSIGSVWVLFAAAVLPAFLI